MITRTPVLVVVLAAGCAYDAPLVPSIDPATGEDAVTANVITGDLVLAGPIDTLGPVMIFVTDAANPMPPYGTGRPITVGTVPADRFTATGTGELSAPYSVSNVPDGDYVITALMDVDRNFGPLVDAMGGATCGDVVGAHLADLQTGALGVVSVAGGDLAAGVPIILGNTLPLERPAFTVAGFGLGGNVVDPLATLTDPTSQRLTLVAQGIDSAIYTLPGPASFGPTSCGAIFPVWAPDTDGDGNYDPHPTFGALGLPDLWPRVYLQYLGVPTGDPRAPFETSGLGAGESWAAEAMPSPAYALLGMVPPGGRGYFPTLDMVWLPAAEHTTAAGTEVVQDPTAIPAGAWSITVVSFTGETWTVPNQLAGFPSADPSFQPLSQAVFLEVQ